MSATVKPVRILQAVAAIAGLAVLLWSLGLPSFRFAEAANLTTVSDTLSDSAPNVGSNHTIVFSLPTDGSGIGAGGTFTITFPVSTFDLTNVTVNDFDLATTTDYTVATAAAGATWGVATTSNTITFTSGTETIAAGATVTVEVGTNATFGATGVHQIVNPASSSYEVNISTSGGDSGATRVVILDNVLVTASVDTTFTFSVAGVSGGQAVNGTTTTGTSTSNTIPFGLLQANQSTTTAQDLTVTTNASQGFSVTVQIDDTLISSTGADIDLFNNGVETDTPAAWAAPSATLGSENTYGHWGVTSEDATTTRSTEFGLNEWIAASTTPRIVMGHNGPADGTTQGAGTARVGYQIEISSLQEAGDDYSAVLTYVATPTF